VALEWFLWATMAPKPDAGGANDAALALNLATVLARSLPEKMLGELGKFLSADEEDEEEQP
jgi:hypothetical protein